MVNPQYDTGVSAGTIVGTGEGRGVGVGVALPGNTEVQPATRSIATSATIPIPQMGDWFFMNYPACGDIRCGRYLWIYLTAKILGVMVFF